MTLMEILIASVIAVGVLAGVNMFMNSSYRIEKELRQRNTVTEEVAAALAMVHIAKRVEAADRIVKISGADGVQLRIPPEDFTQLDSPPDYHWERYAYDNATGELRFFPQGDCNNPETLAREVSNVTFQFADEAPDAPGGPCLPGGDDCNLLVYTIRWDNGLSGPDRKTHQFNSNATSRLVGDTKVDQAAGNLDSGNQLSITAPQPPDVSSC